MEKGSPHCKLLVVRSLAQAGNVRLTQSAREGAAALGLDLQAVLDVVLAL